MALNPVPVGAEFTVQVQLLQLAKLIGMISSVPGGVSYPGGTGGSKWYFHCPISSVSLKIQLITVSGEATKSGPTIRGLPM